MRKKYSIVCGLVIVVMLLVFMNGCDATTTGTASTGKTASNKLEFETIGIYAKSVFGSEYIIYKFGEPNSSVVVYETIDGIFLVGEDTEDIDEKGDKYADAFMPERKFIGLSEKYFLFETAEGRVAVELQRKKAEEGGEGFYNKHFFDQLPDDEKKGFIYPVECITVTK